MNLHRLKTLIVQPVVAEMNWPQPLERTLLLLAIAVQESNLKYRYQYPSGPARSWWQIEMPTCDDCLKRCKAARDLLEDLGLGMLTRPIFERLFVLETSDVAACAVAAGILRLTPGKLPAVGDETAALNYYLKAWRPGKPAPQRWPAAYKAAMEASV